jgi:hypothetical protein
MTHPKTFAGELRLTVAEQAAYGGAFAAEYRKSIAVVPSHLVHDSTAWEQWERGQATSAAEVACGIVERLREIRPEMVAGFGEGSDVLAMYDACTRLSRRRKRKGGKGR